MVILADTDIVLKLTACDLLDDTLDMFGVTVEEVFVLSSEIRSVCLYNKEVIAEYPREILNKVVIFGKIASPITTGIDPEEQRYMDAAEIIINNVPQHIDIGEQVIYGATRNLKDFHVLTCDKKSLRTLAVAPGCGGIHKRMEKRVCCLEQVILLLISEFGFEYVRDRVLPARKHDFVLNEVFEAGINATQPDVENALKKWVNDLHNQTRDLLADL